MAFLVATSGNFPHVMALAGATCGDFPHVVEGTYRPTMSYHEGSVQAIEAVRRFSCTDSGEKDAGMVNPELFVQKKPSRQAYSCIDGAFGKNGRKAYL